MKELEFWIRYNRQIERINFPSKDSEKVLSFIPEIGEIPLNEWYEKWAYKNACIASDKSEKEFMELVKELFLKQYVYMRIKR